MTVIDASVWISAVVPGDVHHDRSLAWIIQHNRIGHHLVVPAHFPAEVAGVIFRIGRGQQSLELTLETLFDPAFFELHELSIDLARRAANVAGSGAIHGSDAIYVALAAELDLPLITWDTQQRQRGALFCRTMTPIEALDALS